jgi:hypothetical protein
MSVSSPSSNSSTNHYHTKRLESVTRDGASRRMAFPSARYLNPASLLMAAA